MGTALLPTIHTWGHLPTGLSPVVILVRPPDRTQTLGLTLTIGCSLWWGRARSDIPDLQEVKGSEPVCQACPEDAHGLATAQHDPSKGSSHLPYPRLQGHPSSICSLYPSSPRSFPPVHHVPASGGNLLSLRPTTSWDNALVGLQWPLK